MTGAAAIELVGVWKTFGREPVLRGVDLRVEVGETCVVLGKSGSGKTVLLKIVEGLMKADAGLVRVLGEDLSRMDEKTLRRFRLNLGILFQAGALFDGLSVFENVAFPLQEHSPLTREEVKDRVFSLLRRLGLEDAANALPSQLSGGMRKRVAFARAVVTGPKLLLYDEPTAGLDPLTTEYVAEVIREGKRNHVTSLLITHDLPSAFSLADNIALLHEGQLVARGPPDAFRASSHPAVREFLKEWLELRAAMGP